MTLRRDAANGVPDHDKTAQGMRRFSFGLVNPIKSNTLYGQAADRLMVTRLRPADLDRSSA
jgi:hypothetical protein